MEKGCYIILLFAVVSIKLSAQEIIPLYNSAIPNATGYSMKEQKEYWGNLFVGYKKISQPSVTVYLPSKEKATGTAVIICPGGGYVFETYKYEGEIIAETFQKKGIAAFILKYRLPSDSIMVDKTIGPLQDAQQAIKIVRQRASEWNVDTGKVGIMGFSAGGHLASTAGTHFEKAYIPNSENISLRPSFMALVYPVISMTNALTHKGSQESLLGKDPSDKDITLFSSELQVTRKTPPTWITHAGDDTTVTVENSIKFYEALIKNKVPAEMHLYPKGGHGFVLWQPADKWMEPLFAWMEKSGWVK